MQKMVYSTLPPPHWPSARPWAWADRNPLLTPILSVQVTLEKSLYLQVLFYCLFAYTVVPSLCFLQTTARVFLKHKPNHDIPPTTAHHKYKTLHCHHENWGGPHGPWIPLHYTSFHVPFTYPLWSCCPPFCPFSTSVTGAWQVLPVDPGWLPPPCHFCPQLKHHFFQRPPCQGAQNSPSPSLAHHPILSSSQHLSVFEMIRLN